MSYIGAGCCQPNHLGFAIAAALPVAAATGPFAPFVIAGALIGSILPFLHLNIGGGRKEADLIVPEQEKFGNALSELDQILAHQTLSASDLQQLDAQLRDMWRRYQAFIYDSAFTADGDTRASDQSKATLEPMYQNRLDRIAQMLNAVLGRPNVPTMIQSSGVPSLEFRTTSDLSLPQAGFNQPAVSHIPSNVIGPIGAGMDTGLLFKLGLVGVIAYAVSRR